MAKEYRFGFVIEGDADSGVKALRKVKEEIDGLDSANKKTKQSADGLAKSSTDLDSTFGSLGKSVGVAAAALGGIATVAYFKGLIADSIDAADNLNDLSKTTGLTVERLSGLVLAAQESGTQIGDVAKAINFLTKGVGQNAEKYRELGITARDPLEAFKQLADQFVATTDIQARNALAADALGKSWETVGPLLAEGGAAIQEMVDRGQDLSGITTKMATDADAYNDSIAVIQQSVSGLVNAMAASLLPSLTSSAEAVATFASDGSLEEWLDGAKIAAEALAVIMLSRAAPSLIALAAQGYTAVASLTAVEASLLTTAVATRGLNAALMLVGGPIGATALVVGGLITLVAGMESAAERAARLRGEINELSEAELRNAKASAESEREAALASLARSEMVRDRSAADERAYEIQAKRVQEVTDRINSYDAALEKVGSTSTATTDAYLQMLGVTQEVKTETGHQTKETAKLIQKLEEEKTALSLTTREQAIYRAELEALAADATPEAIVQAKKLAAEIYDTKEAFENSQKAAEEWGKGVAAVNETVAAIQKKSADEQARVAEEWVKGIEAVNETVSVINQKTADELAQQNKDAAEKTAKYWQDFGDSMGDIFAQWVVDGKNAGDLIEDYLKATAARIVSNWASSGIQGLLTGKGLSGFNIGSAVSGGGSVDYSSLFGSAAKAGSSALGLGSGGVEYLDSAGKAVTNGGIAGTIKTGLINAGAGIAGGYVGTELGSALTGKEANSNYGAGAGAAVGALWGPWGSAIGGAIGGFIDSAFGSDGKKAVNAGFLIHDVPGAKADQKFETAQFASGFQPVGFARRESQAEAESVIDSFRQYDTALKTLADTLGISVSYNASTFRPIGTSEQGSGDGVFVGLAGEGGYENALKQQHTEFVEQWVKGLDGKISSEAMQAILSAGDANAMLAVAGQLTDVELARRVNVPAFASGGFHRGGIALVGEEGPELLDIGPSRIYSARDTKSMLSSSAELKGLREDFSNMMIALNTLIVNTGQSARAINESVRNGAGVLAVKVVA